MKEGALRLSAILAMALVLFCALSLILTGVSDARDIQKRSPGKGAPMGSNGNAAAQGSPGQNKALATMEDDKDDKCLCSCGMCYTKPEWRPPPPPNCTTYCIYKVKHYEPCFSGDICAPLDFVPVYDYYQVCSSSIARKFTYSECWNVHARETVKNTKNKKKLYPLNS